MGLAERLNLEIDENGKIVLPIKFKTIDHWSRPVYRCEKVKYYFGSTQSLFPDKEKAPNGTVEEINNYFRNNMEELECFGTSIDDDPLGGLNPKYKLKIID
jgi:hypothetical protein